MKNLENLMYAIKNNDVDKCREFLKNNDVYLDRRLTVGDNKIYTTPLTFAARYGNIQIIRMLLKAGADPNYGIINESRLRPLSEAVIHKRDNDVVKVLIEAGADVNYNEQFSSIPTVLLPGIVAILADSELVFLAMSSDKLIIFEVFIPAAGSSS